MFLNRCFFLNGNRDLLFLGTLQHESFTLYEHTTNLVTGVATVPDERITCETALTFFNPHLTTKSIIYSQAAVPVLLQALRETALREDVEIPLLFERILACFEPRPAATSPFTRALYDAHDGDRWLLALGDVDMLQKLTHAQPRFGNCINHDNIDLVRTRMFLALAAPRVLALTRRSVCQPVDAAFPNADEIDATFHELLCRQNVPEWLSPYLAALKEHRIAVGADSAIDFAFLVASYADVLLEHHVMDIEYRHDFRYRAVWEPVSCAEVTQFAHEHAVSVPSRCARAFKLSNCGPLDVVELLQETQLRTYKTSCVWSSRAPQVTFVCFEIASEADFFHLKLLLAESRKSALLAFLQDRDLSPDAQALLTAHACKTLAGRAITKKQGTIAAYQSVITGASALLEHYDSRALLQTPHLAQALLLLSVRKASGVGFLIPRRKTTRKPIDGIPSSLWCPMIAESKVEATPRGALVRLPAQSNWHCLLLMALLKHGNRDALQYFGWVGHKQPTITVDAGIETAHQLLVHVSAANAHESIQETRVRLPAHEVSTLATRRKFGYGPFHTCFFYSTPPWTLERSLTL